MIVVLDTNVIISAMIKDSIKRNIIVTSGMNFCYPEGALREIAKYESLIIEKSGMNKDSLRRLTGLIFSYVKIIPERVFKCNEKEAEDVMKKIDIADALFVSTALSFRDSVIWSDDSHLKKQNIVKVFNTPEMLDFIMKRSD